MSKRPDIGKLLADVTAAYEGAVGVAVERQRSDLSPEDAWVQYLSMALRLAHLVELHAQIGALLEPRKD